MLWRGRKMQVSALSLFRERNMLTARVTARLFWLSLTDKVLNLIGGGWIYDNS